MALSGRVIYRQGMPPVRSPMARAAAALAAAVLACVLVTPALPHNDGLGGGSLRIAGSHHVMPAVKAKVVGTLLRPAVGPRWEPVPALVPLSALVLLLLVQRRRGRPIARPPVIVHAAHSIGVRGPPAPS
jgi:hypothetical protein